MRRAGWRRLSIVVLSICLLGQMALPPGHPAPRAGGTSGVVALALHGKSVSRAELCPAHDPTTCPVCQRLLHPKPAATPPAMPARSLPVLLSNLPAPALRAHEAVARTGHPPRAPPQISLSLA
ncbi:MAG TPA: hypothetical protein VMS55_15930 [Myxococcota bacterium]|nr:hypothetical protein [Myxococcota bacterium]